MTRPTSILIIGAGELGTAILSNLTSHPRYHQHRDTTTTLAVLRRASTLASADPATQSELAALASRGIVVEGGDLVASPESPLEDLISGRVLRGLGGWGNRVTVTDVRGIGTVVADLVFNPGDSETGGKVVYAAGDTVSYGEVADVVEAVYGGEWKREEWDREFLKRKLAEQPDDLMVKYQNAFGAGIGVSWEMERTVNHQRGIRITGLREYVEENRERLLQLSE
ncbi:hypothetical protein N658DRAFT_519210 [Parathielavia hyrcaniae]|uniref:NmrA-like domain-containing protein n=1 Tax=Parathielavia hyrcaniae TaxID=113614 RepID=A0AAN6PR29_9PEZI|nr:hypothetical protein N658DRAFT_519210 [Parathielavia hyrcaniae]